MEGISRHEKVSGVIFDHYASGSLVLGQSVPEQDFETSNVPCGALFTNPVSRTSRIGHKHAFIVVYYSKKKKES